jgi:16S rRNA (adenine1518-N6/adenine1519-N6)-dimethyltransferase
MKHFHAKKRFSQNFLKGKGIVKKIVDCADIDNETVIEIGAGKGTLTKLISAHAKMVYAVELDRELISTLEGLDLSNVKVVNKDFLRLDLRDFGKPVIVGNIPYSITTQIIEKLAQQKRAFKRAVLTVQKEYGARLLAKTGSAKYGSITLFTDYHFQVKKKFAIPARFFSPQPKVSSLVIRLTGRAKPFYPKDEKAFFEMIKGIFCYRRKYMKNALMNYLHNVPQGLDSVLLQKRPGDLTLHDYYTVYCKL